MTIPRDSSLIPAALADVALIDIREVCAAAAVGETYFLAEVRAGRAPQPIRFGQRCTRWRLAEIRTWLIERAARAAAEQAPIAARSDARARGAQTARDTKRRAGAGAAA